MKIFSLMDGRVSVLSSVVFFFSNNSEEKIGHKTLNCTYIKITRIYGIINKVIKNVWGNDMFAENT